MCIKLILGLNSSYGSVDELVWNPEKSELGFARSGRAKSRARAKIGKIRLCQYGYIGCPVYTFFAPEIDCKCLFCNSRLPCATKTDMSYTRVLHNVVRACKSSDIFGLCFFGNISRVRCPRYMFFWHVKSIPNVYFAI